MRSLPCHRSPRVRTAATGWRRWHAVWCSRRPSSFQSGVMRPYPSDHGALLADPLFAVGLATLPTRSGRSQRLSWTSCHPVWQPARPLYGRRCPSRCNASSGYAADGQRCVCPEQDMPANHDDPTHDAPNLTAGRAMKRWGRRLKRPRRGVAQPRDTGHVTEPPSKLRSGTN